MRWVHRSSFVIRPPPRGSVRTYTYTQTSNVAQMLRIPIPDSNGLFVDAGWYGTIVVETEGTNEALADLQDRCGPGAFPSRARGVHALVRAQGQGAEKGGPGEREREAKKVFRILREKRYVS